MLLALFACAATRADALPVTDTSSEPLVFQGANIVGLGVTSIRVEDGVIVELGGTDTSPSIDVSGRYIVPAFIDSHVHLAYLPEGAAMAEGGVAGAVDLAAPLAFLGADHAPLRVLASGPMVTAEGGYPTQSWGRDGYGLECADGEAAAAAVDQLVAAGAGIIKLPVTGAPQLDDEALAAAVERAHARGVRVVSHALGDEEAATAAAAGVDALAHTPTSPLSEATLAAWTGRAVVSTLDAFGGSSTAVNNLRSLRASGATVLYGTDFGNSRDSGIASAEVLLLVEAGLSGEDIISAGTSAPADYWGFPTLGRIEVGRDASFLVLERDPRVDPLVLAEPAQVWIRGERVR